LRFAALPSSRFRRAWAAPLASNSALARGKIPRTKS
jgi:hypothetical protein